MKDFAVLAFLAAVAAVATAACSSAHDTSGASTSASSMSRSTSSSSGDDAGLPTVAVGDECGTEVPAPDGDGSTIDMTANCPAGTFCQFAGMGTTLICFGSSSSSSSSSGSSGDDAGLPTVAVGDQCATEVPAPDGNGSTLDVTANCPAGTFCQFAGKGTTLICF